MSDGERKGVLEPPPATEPGPRGELSPRHEPALRDLSDRIAAAETDLKALEAEAPLADEDEERRRQIDALSAQVNGLLDQARGLLAGLEREPQSETGKRARRLAAIHRQIRRLLDHGPRGPQP